MRRLINLRFVLSVTHLRVWKKSNVFDELTHKNVVWPNIFDQKTQYCLFDLRQLRAFSTSLFFEQFFSTCLQVPVWSNSLRNWKRIIQFFFHSLISSNLHTTSRRQNKFFEGWQIILVDLRQWQWANYRLQTWFFFAWLFRKSFKKMMKSNGDNTLPCGTPILELRRLVSIQFDESDSGF